MKKDLAAKLLKYIESNFADDEDNIKKAATIIDSGDLNKLKSFIDSLDVDFRDNVISYLKGEGIYLTKEEHTMKSFVDFYVEDVELEEAATRSQRIKAARNIRKNKAKIKRGREKAEKRTATAATIDKRAQIRAKKAVERSFIKGDKSKSDLTFAQRANLEKRVEKRKDKISRDARKLKGQVRKDDRSK